MSTLVAFFASGKMALIVAAVLGGLGVLWRMISNAKKAGRNEAIIEGAKARERAREQEIQRIKNAADSGARVRPDDGGMQHDPFNRDK